MFGGHGTSRFLSASPASKCGPGVTLAPQSPGPRLAAPPVRCFLSLPLPPPFPPRRRWNPLSWAMEAAAIIAIALLDYADFALIVALLLTNATISFVEESNADRAIKALTSGVWVDELHPRPMACCGPRVEPGGWGGTHPHTDAHTQPCQPQPWVVQSLLRARAGRQGLPACLPPFLPSRLLLHLARPPAGRRSRRPLGTRVLAHPPTPGHPTPPPLQPWPPRPRRSATARCQPSKPRSWSPAISSWSAWEISCPLISRSCPRATPTATRRPCRCAPAPCVPPEEEEACLGSVAGRQGFRGGPGARLVEAARGACARMLEGAGGKRSPGWLAAEGLGGLGFTLNQLCPCRRSLGPGFRRSITLNLRPRAPPARAQLSAPSGAAPQLCVWPRQDGQPTHALAAGCPASGPASPPRPLLCHPSRRSIRPR